MAGFFKALLGGGDGPVKEAEVARQSLQLHDGNLTIAIDSGQNMIIMQIDENSDGKPLIFDLKNHTISNVTAVYPPVSDYAPSAEPLQDQIDVLRTEIQNLKALLPSNDQSQTG
jgi:hypothetical protein